MCQYFSAPIMAIGMHVKRDCVRFISQNTYGFIKKTPQKEAPIGAALELIYNSNI
jgi:hypothetical protein